LRSRRGARIPDERRCPGVAALASRAFYLFDAADNRRVGGRDGQGRTDRRRR
jgi:hypothetical protein